MNQMRPQFAFERPPPLTLAWMEALFVLTTLIAGLSPSPTAATIAENIAFSPQGVLEHFRVWTMVTFPLVDAPSWIGVLISMLMLYWFAAPLESRWGQQRFGLFVVLTSLAASGSVLLVSLATPFAVTPTVRSIITAFIFAWGLTFRTRELYLFFFLRIRGIQMVWLGVAFILLDAVYDGWQLVVPRTAAALMATALVLGLFKPNVVKLWWDWLLVKLRIRKPPKLTLVPPPSSAKPSKYDIN